MVLRKIKHCCQKAYILVCVRLYALWFRSPWHMAIVRTAFWAYRESISYRIRCIELGSEFARSAFAEYNELGHWKWAAKKDKKFNWWLIVFLPYLVHPAAME